ncbi:hypothetical protein PVK06_004895 [Gossypium arboreum]|uniref:Uncharacterized protein n=1 Tax=Gossypium arboreum TaxID=29729 RepID=A0ABR0QU44_GOSAR|nr:hypothetical protein PVK06_004895 [Gossypium arboreum]
MLLALRSGAWERKTLAARIARLTAKRSNVKGDRKPKCRRCSCFSGNCSGEDSRYKLNYVRYCFTKICDTHASDFMQTILSNLKLLFDEYVKNSKSTSSSLDGSSNLSNNDPGDSRLHQSNFNKVDFGGDYDESDDYK